MTSLKTITVHHLYDSSNHLCEYLSIFISDKLDKL